MRGAVDKVIVPLVEGLLAFIMLLALAIWLDRLGRWHDCGASTQQAMVWGMLDRPTPTYCHMIATEDG